MNEFKTDGARAVISQTAVTEYSAEIVDGQLVVLCVSFSADGHRFVARGSEQLRNVDRFGFGIVIDRLAELKTDAWFRWVCARQARERLTDPALEDEPTRDDVPLQKRMAAIATSRKEVRHEACHR